MVVDERRILPHGHQRIYHGRQFIVLHLDHIEGLFRGLLIDRCNSRYGIADKANFVQGEIGLVALG